MIIFALKNHFERGDENRKGKVEKSEVLECNYQGFDAPALKGVNKTPDWTPGKQRGKAVKVWFVVNIEFNDKKK